MTDFANLQADTLSVGGFANENGLIPTRYGGSKKSWQYLVDQFEAEFAEQLLEINKSRGYRVVGTFTAGFEYELFNDVGIDASGNSWIYVGTGAPVATVAPGTDPSLSTDYQQATFNDHNATVNRDAIGAHDDIYSRRLGSIADLTTTTVSRTNGLTVRVAHYHASLQGGGGKFEWVSTEPKSNHNGGTVIDPDKTFPDDWSNQTELNSWFNTTNAGNGCWVRVSQDSLKFTQFGVVNDGDEANPTDNRLAFRKALQVADGRLIEGAGNHSYGINQPSRPAVPLPSNTNIDMQGGTLRKLSTSTNAEPFLENETNSENITIKNAFIRGIGANGNVSDQGSALLLFDNDGAWLENVTTDETEGDGLQFRRAENTFIVNCEVKNFGRNAISPTSGSFYIDGLRTTGTAYTGANPGLYWDAENNSNTETTISYIVNSEIRNMTFVDFYNSGGGAFNHTLHMSNTKIGPSFRPFRLLNRSGANSESANINLDSTVTIETTSDGAITIEGINNGRLNNVRLIAADTVDDKFGVAFENTVSGWDIQCNTESTINFKEDILVRGGQTDINIIGRYRRVQLQGASSVDLTQANLTVLTLNGTECTARASLDTEIGTLSRNNGAAVTQLTPKPVTQGIRQENELLHDFISPASFAEHATGTINFLTGNSEAFGSAIRGRASSNNAGRIVFQTSFGGSGKVDRWQFAERGHLEPLTDNTLDIGSASNRARTIYAGTGTINTSDDRLKEYFDITEAEERVAAKLRTMKRKYKFKGAIEEKGDKARFHFGFSAQEVKATFESEGLDGFDYGVLCWDEWEEQPEIIDEETGEALQSYKTAGDRYGLRYEELLVFLL